LIGHWTEPVGEMFVIVTWVMLTETAPKFVTDMLNPWVVKFRAPGGLTIRFSERACWS